MHNPKGKKKPNKPSPIIVAQAHSRNEQIFPNFFLFLLQHKGSLSKVDNQ